MPAIRVQKNSGTQTGTGTIAFPNNVVNGNLILVSAVKLVTASEPFAAGDLTKSAGTATVGTIALDVSRDQAIAGANRHAGVWSIPITGSGSLTLQLATTDGTAAVFIAIVEYAEMDTSGSRLAASNSNSSSSTTTTPDAGSAASGQSGVYFAVLNTGTGGGQTITESAEFNLIGEAEGAGTVGGSAVDKIVNSSQTWTPSWTTSTAFSFAAAVGVYKDVAGTTSPTPGGQGCPQLGGL